MTPAYRELWIALQPECALVVGALVVLGIDLFGGRHRNASQRIRIAATLGMVATLIAAVCAWRSPTSLAAFDGVLVLDPLTRAVRLGVLVLSALTLLSLPGLARLRHPAEYVAVVLFATAGFTLMAAAQQLLLAFLALELASLSLYVLTGFDQSRPESAEAGLKYFLFGGISAAFLLFGFSLIYGLTGSIELPVIAARLGTLAPSALLVVALVMVLAGFGFKAAAAPFHLWAPDVYQGAPAPSAALIASASKLAGFALFVRLLWGGLAPAAGAAGGGAPGWMPVVVVLSGVSLLLGNVAALAQSNVRRLLAYSAIAHAGALLLGVLAAGKFGPARLVYYAATYGLATIGAFVVIGAVERAGRCQQLGDLAGLHKRSPLLAGSLLVFVLSLAGIPPLAGFFGKFAVFAAALQLNGLAGPAGWLALLAIAMSAVALYYYLLVLKQALVARPGEEHATPIRVSPAVAATLIVTAALLVVLGVFPSLLLRLIS